jgi:hypothetical protein
LMRKNCAVVTPSTLRPATMIGPTTRDPLMFVELSEIAPGRSCRLTMVGNAADHAGAFKALPMPTPIWTMNSAQIAASRAASGASAAENTSCTDCMAINHFRRSKRSAITPPGIARISSGPSWAKTSRATIDALPVRW